MYGERDAAVGTLHHVTALRTLQEVREAPAVEKQKNLLAGRQAGIDCRVEVLGPRDRPAFRDAPGPAQIYEPHRRKRPGAPAGLSWAAKSP